MPTLIPALNLVPRWRTRMEPPVTCSPPNSFTPRRWEWESRPLRLEPTPFLCAMGIPLQLGCRMISKRFSSLAFSRAKKLGLDGLDADFREALAMALGALVGGGLLLLEDDHLLGPVVG